MMTKLNPTSVLSALSIVAMLITPAFAHKQKRHPLHQQRMSRLHRQSGFYSYATIPLGQKQRDDLPYYGNAPYDQRDDW
jgi:hypothetical protein